METIQKQMTNRRMRVRMSGGVGGGRETRPSTRFVTLGVIRDPLTSALRKNRGGSRLNDPTVTRSASEPTQRTSLRRSLLRLRLP